MNQEINRKVYLTYARTFTKTELRFIREFTEWLPQMFINCHAHCNLPEHVRSIDERAYNHMLSTLPSFSLEESKEWYIFLHPGKIVRTLRFPNTFRGIDHRAANLYLLVQSPEQDRIALFGLPDDSDYTIEMLKHPRVSALKMYYSYFEPPATEIYQYFPKVILEAAQERNIPIILHPSKRIVMCLEQILKLIYDFPHLKICLAHLGLAKQIIPGLEDTFATIAKYSQVHFDTALVPSAEVINMAIRIVGTDRIMYGSDEPLHLIRSVPYIHPQRGERLATEYLYHWVDMAEHQEYKHLAVGATHTHWQALCAIKTAISSFPKKEQETIKQKLFNDNAKQFYGF